MKKKLSDRILTYAAKYPLAFLGMSCWFATPFVLGILTGLFDVHIPGWFIPFMFCLGVIFIYLSERYEKGA
jgi:hypothetical protein